jgi:hypothetical protein
MKFTIAAGILTQVLPAISEKSPSKLLEQDLSNEHGFTASRARKSFLPRGRETIAYKNPELLDGLLKNVPFAQTMKACDPSSNDPDIGILSCDAGYECVFDQDTASGGLCTSISRDLQEEPYRCNICGDGSVVSVYNFDISVPDFEGANCGVLALIAYSDVMAAAANVTLDATSCLGIGMTAQAAGCCSASYGCNPCGEGELLTDAMADYGGYLITCGFIAGNFNDTACSLYGPYIAPTCCSSSPTAGPVVPTPAPVASPSVPDTPASPDTPSVPDTTDAPGPSGSEGRWSPRAIVTMMGLTVVTAGSLLLN